MGARADIDRLLNEPTPFYFYDMELLHRTLQAAAMEASCYGYKLHYALKANFDPRVLAAVRGAGIGADCVSGNEVRSALESGCPPREVVFAGVGKSDQEICYALEQDIFSFNVESLEELKVINDCAARMGRRGRIAFRINPDVDPRTHKNISTGGADAKFGISYTELNEAIASLGRLKHVEIVGIHFHIGSQILDMQAFEELCLRVNMISQWFVEQGIVLRHLNLGGGLGVNYEDPDRALIPDFAAYFGLMHRLLEVDPSQTVHFELGRSLVAQCAELVTRVLYNKQTGAGTQVVIVDAGMTDLMRPALYQAYHKIENLTSSQGAQKYMVAGPVCESTDIFGREVPLPITRRGDLLTLRTAGAYGVVMASRYNLRELPRSLYSDEP